MFDFLHQTESSIFNNRSKQPSISHQRILLANVLVGGGRGLFTFHVSLFTYTFSLQTIDHEQVSTIKTKEAA